MRHLLVARHQGRLPHVGELGCWRGGWRRSRRERGWEEGERELGGGGTCAPPHLSLT